MRSSALRAKDDEDWDSFYPELALEKRLWEHQNKLGANFTKKHLPFELLYCEEYERIDDAFNREKQIQGWSRKKKEALINNKFEDLKGLAGCRNISNSSNR